MANQIVNPLNLLNLAGLTRLEPKPVTKDALRAAKATVTGESPYGILEDLTGTWQGTGFNLIEVPNMNQIQPGPPPKDKFRVILNSTAETLVFTKIAGGIVNKGNAQADITYFGVHYLQQISDVNLPKGEDGIHLETGLFLNLVATTAPPESAGIARLGSIPHGDTILAQGQVIEVAGGPTIDKANSLPFTIVDGKRVDDNSDPYLAILKNAPLPPGIPVDAILDPNIILQKAIEGQKIIQTKVIFLDANPMDGVGNVPPDTKVGGINNIPFINVNANPISLSAIFWIETVENPDGTTFTQLQYTQTVILDFPVFGAPPDNKLTDIKWPHISVATLRKQ
jgi:hypothetical protein